MAQDGLRQSLPSSAGTPNETVLDAAQILASVGEVAYDWRLDTDALLWSANAKDVLLIDDMAAVSTGRGYAQLLEAENAQARFDAVMQSDKRDDGHGVPYQIQYRHSARPQFGYASCGSRITAAGLPAQMGDRRAHTASLRVINERYEHERRLTFLARYDGLTGELNRHHLTEVLEDTLEDAIRFRSSCGFLSGCRRQSVAHQRVLRLRRRRRGDRRCRQASTQPNARQGHARPLFGQQIRRGAARLYARRHGDRRRAPPGWCPRRDGARQSPGRSLLPSRSAA